MKEEYKTILQGKVTIPSKVDGIQVKTIGKMHTAGA
jgi:hypothetical protein